MPVLVRQGSWYLCFDQMKSLPHGVVALWRESPHGAHVFADGRDALTYVPPGWDQPFSLPPNAQFVDAVETLLAYRREP